MDVPEIITRDLGSVDERLSFEEIMEVTRKQADAMPLTVHHQGATYQAFDVKLVCEGHINTAIGYYKRVE